MMADELGASPESARRAALLHDIGKSVTHEVEGPHALVGGELARIRRGRGRRARDGGPPQRGRARDDRGGARAGRRRAVRCQAGARGESLEQYVKRLRDLEQIATRHKGVEKVYAMQAGREIRVMVTPGATTTTPRRCSRTRSPGRSSTSSNTRADQGDGDHVSRVPCITLAECTHSAFHAALTVMSALTVVAAAGPASLQPRTRRLEVSAVHEQALKRRAQRGPAKEPNGRFIGTFGCVRNWAYSGAVIGTGRGAFDATILYHNKTAAGRPHGAPVPVDARRTEEDLPTGLRDQLTVR